MTSSPNSCNAVWIPSNGSLWRFLRRSWVANGGRHIPKFDIAICDLQRYYCRPLAPHRPHCTRSPDACCPDRGSGVRPSPPVFTPARRSIPATCLHVTGVARSGEEASAGPAVRWLRECSQSPPLCTLPAGFGSVGTGVHPVCWLSASTPFPPDAHGLVARRSQHDSRAVPVLSEGGGASARGPPLSHTPGGASGYRSNSRVVVLAHCSGNSKLYNAISNRRWCRRVALTASDAGAAGLSVRADRYRHIQLCPDSMVAAYAGGRAQK